MGKWAISIVRDNGRLRLGGIAAQGSTRESEAISHEVLAQTVQ